VLAGKRVEKHRFATPLGYPSLSGKYPAKVPTDDPRPARSCVHCHQVGEAERRFFRDQALPIPEEVLFPYPNPTVLGLHMDPKHQATVKSVDAGSNAAFAGFAPGDRIVAVENEPILSTADIQWILHKQVGPARLKVEVDHDGQRAEHTLVLEAGYRRRGDLSYRATTWDLRRMALGGLLLEALSEAERRRLATSPRGPMALRVAHVGEYGEHAVAKNAGVRKNDIVIGFDGRNDLTRETDVIAYALQQKRPGDLVELRLLRDGETQTVSIKLQ
jgi:S1-C subfamily serine protease